MNCKQFAFFLSSIQASQCLLNAKEGLLFDGSIHPQPLEFNYQGLAWSWPAFWPYSIRGFWLS